MQTEERLTLKEMCERFGVTPRTLRHYEYIELLFPEKVGRTRYYGPREIARMKLILRGRRFGFSLEQIRRWLLLHDADPTHRLQRETWIKAAGRKLEELKAQKQHLEEVIAELEEMRARSIRELEALDAEGATGPADEAPAPESRRSGGARRGDDERQAVHA